MSNDIRDRLRRIGVHKGLGHLRPAAPRASRAPATKAPVTAQDAASASNLDPLTPLWNLELENTLGVACVKRTIYPVTHQHGASTLGRVLDMPDHLVARLGDGAAIDVRDAVFLDTETTGLVGGTGTLVFLVGLGYFEGPDAFVVDQYFLPDPGQEAGMLVALDAFINRRSALITFNGRGFDVPLLETRFTLSRMAPALSARAHLDLLMPARRAWRIELASCSLGSLEYHMLDVRRDQQDIAGFLIPDLYREYLQTGDPAEMQRVMYHNLLDILSMVTLLPRLCNAISAPNSMGEFLAAGLYHESRGQLSEAVAIYTSALAAAQAQSSNLSPSHRRLLARLAGCLKRQACGEQAVPYWRELAAAGDIDACLELAKHYEWHAVDIEQALASARAAQALCRDSFTRAQVDHRIQRLQRKLEM